MIRQHSSWRHVLSQCPKQRHFPPVLVTFFNISGGWMPLFRALAKNMAPMTNADESPTNRLTLFPIYLSLFIVSTLCLYTRIYKCHEPRIKPTISTVMHSCYDKCALCEYFTSFTCHYLHILRDKVCIPTLHYLHTIVFTYFTLYIYKCVTLMYFLSFFPSWCKLLIGKF